MKCVLHIGTEKTGSTSVQAFLHSNRKLLRSRGIAFLRSTGLKNDLKLALACRGDGRINRQVRELGIEDPSAKKAWRDELLANMRAEIEQLPEHVHTVIFSAEHFHSRLISPEEVQNLHRVLAPFFRSFQVLVYIRRQDELAVSLYSTALRSGFAPKQILPVVPRKKLPPYYDYRAMLQRWETEFGSESISVTVFERENLVDGDLISDFCHRTEIDLKTAKYRLPIRANESLSADAQDFYLWFNRRFTGATGNRNSRSNTQHRLRVYLDSRYGGKPRLPALADARGFYKHFRADNNLIAQQYFKRDQLFDEDFSKYPKELTPFVSNWFIARVLVGFAGYSLLQFIRSPIRLSRGESKK